MTELSRRELLRRRRARPRRLPLERRRSLGAGDEGEARLASRALPGAALSRDVIVIGAGSPGSPPPTSSPVPAARSRCSRLANGSADGRWSPRLDNGAVVEMGAEFILPGNTEVARLADELGLGLWDKGMRYGRREPRGGTETTEAELDAAVAAVAAALDSLAGEPSARELLDSLEVAPGAREAVLAQGGDLDREPGERGPGRRPRGSRAHRGRSRPERRRGQPGSLAGAGRPTRRRGSARRPGRGAGVGAGRRPGDDRGRPRGQRGPLRDRGPRERLRPDPVRAGVAAGEGRGARGSPLRTRGEDVRPARRAGATERGDERPRALVVLDGDR